MSQERVESQGFYEMLWDCEFCETKGLLAKSQRHCPECGGKQNSDKRYFPPEGAATRVDGHKYEGSDKYCPNCNAPQSAAAHNCTNCGAPMTEGREVKGVAAPVAPPKPKRKWWIPVLIGLVVIVGIVMLVRWCNRTESKLLTVSGHRWERAIAVEQYGDQQEDGWRNEVPSDARFVTCHRKQRSTKQVADGETCRDEKVDKKDGTFEVVRKCKPKYRSEPVEDDFCRYTVTRWKTIDTIKTTGAGLSPAWPDKGLPPETHTQVPGAKRRGKKTETYWLDLQGQSCDVSEAVWRTFTDGQQVKAEVRTRNNEIVCDTIAPAKK